MLRLALPRLNLAARFAPIRAVWVPKVVLVVTLVMGAVTAIVSAARLTSAPPERMHAPVNGWPVRRRRGETLHDLFMDTSEFKRRLVLGWESRDRERVPR